MEHSRFWEDTSTLSLSRNYSPFMEPEDSLPRSQKPATDAYPEPNESDPHPPTLLP
jgi:hypothetical protein